MEHLRIATPPRAARAKKRHEVPIEKKKGRVAAVFSFFRGLFSNKDKIKQDAELKGLGDDEDEDNGEGSVSARTTVAERERMASKPSFMLQLKAKAAKALSGKQEEEKWDGNGVPPWVERGSSVAWSEDKSRVASEYGGGIFDYMANPSRIISEPPVFFDPVEDRVRSRWLPVFSLCAFPSILATVLLLDVWDKSTLFKLDTRPVLNTLFRSGDPMLLNMLPAANMSMKVQALNRHGWPLQNLELKVSVVDWELSPSIVRDLPFCTRTLKASVLVGNAKVCQYALTGTSATTDRDGVATFTELAFEAGLPGAYRVEFFAEKSLLNVTEWLTVKASVSQLIADESYTAERMGGEDVVFSGEQGLPLPLKSTPPALRVVLASGVGSGGDGDASRATRGFSRLLTRNLTVFAINLDAAWDLGGTLAEHIHVSSNPELARTPNTHVALVGNAERVDAGGVARFPSLAVAGYDRPYLLLAFVCQGQVLVWSQAEPLEGYNVSEHAAARGGRAGFATIAYTQLPPPSAALAAAAAAATPSGESMVPGKKAFRVTEGAAFAVEMQHDAALAGGVFVAKLAPAVPGASVDPAAADLHAEEAGAQLAVPTYHKLLLGTPPSVQLNPSGRGRGIFRTSLFGKPGQYNLLLYFMGLPIYSFDVTVEGAVDMVMPGALLDSPVLCGVRLAPVCRHAEGSCSFGPVAGKVAIPLPQNAVCDGLTLLTTYASTGDGVLPWAQVFDDRESADRINEEPSAKLMSLEMVPWDTDVTSLKSNTNLTGNPEDWEVVTWSRPARLTGRYGSGKIAAFKLLVVPAGVAFLMPILRVDSQLYPIPVKVRVASLVPQGFSNCGLYACTWIKTEVGLPGRVTAGALVTPAPRAKLVGGDGSGIPGRVVCLVYGSADEVERASASATSMSAMWSNALLNFLCAQGAQQGARCAKLADALTDAACAVTDAAGRATLSSVRLRSNAVLADSLAVWRFVAVNAFPDSQISCLNTYSAWAPTCRSTLQSVAVVNTIQRIEPVAAAGMRTGVLQGQRSLQVAANSSVSATGTTLAIPLRCYGAASVVACKDVEARLLRVWNSNGQAEVELSEQSFAEAGDGSGGVLTLTMNTRRAGIYVMELDSYGARDQLFVRMRHDAHALSQLPDRNSANLTKKCEFDCHARNVSNIGRRHPQDIRALATAASGDPLYGAQVWVELVGDGGGLGGQLSGSVSGELLHVSDGAVLSNLALSAALPGTYKFHLRLFNPSPLPPQVDLAPLVTGNFYVKDSVVVTLEKHPPDKTAGGRTRRRGGEGAAEVEAEVELGVVSIEIQRWRGHTSFMYADLWVPPVVTLEIAGVAVPSADLSRAKTASPADSEQVNVSLQGLRVGNYRAAQRRVSSASGLPTETAYVSVMGRVRPLSFARYCLAVGGEGVLRSNASADDSNTLWLPEGLTGSIAVKSVGVLVNKALLTTTPPTPLPLMCSRSFAVSDRVYGLAVLGDYPRRVGQGEEFEVLVQATLSSGEPIEGVVVEAELAQVSCSPVVLPPVKTIAVMENSTGIEREPPEMPDCPDSDLLFKSTNGVMDPLGREQVVVTSTWTTRVMIHSSTGYALKGSVAVTDADGVARVSVLMMRARAGVYRLRFRSGATVSHPTDVIQVTSLAYGMRILQAMEGFGDSVLVSKNPLGPNDFSQAAHEGIVMRKGVHTVTGDISSEMTLKKPDVQVVDAYGNALKRSREVSVHIVSCGRKWMPNGSISFPPSPESGCDEYLDWELGSVPKWVCRTAGKCDAGFTRFSNINFYGSTPSGFMYVFFSSDGLVIEQEEQLYVMNALLPADSSVLSYRLGIMLGLTGTPLILNSNFVQRDRIWIQVSLAGMAVFALFSVLYFQTTVAAYGSPSKVQRELVLCSMLSIISVGSCAVILIRLLLQPDNMQYFTARQNKYLKALRSLLSQAKPPAEQRDAKSRMGTVGSVSAAATNRVHPEPQRQYRATAAAESAGGGGGMSRSQEGRGDGAHSGGSSARSEGSHTALLAGKSFGNDQNWAHKRSEAYEETHAGVAGVAGERAPVGSAAEERGTCGRERARARESETAREGEGEGEGEGLWVSGKHFGPFSAQKAQGKGEGGGGGGAGAAVRRNGRVGKPATAATGTSSRAEPSSRRGLNSAFSGALLRASGKQKSAEKRQARWKPPSLRGMKNSVMLLRTREGRARIMEYWGDVMDDAANWLSGAKAAAGKDGQVQEGFQYPMRLLSGMALSLIGLCIMIVAFESVKARTLFGLERLRAEVVRYRVSLGKWDTSVDSPQEKSALPTPPYSDTYDIVALTYTVMESIYGDGPEIFEGLIDALGWGVFIGNVTVIVAWSWMAVQTMRFYRRRMLELRADRTLVDHWRFPIHEASGYPGRQLWASVMSGLLVWLPTCFTVALFRWGPSSRFFFVWVLLPVGGLCVLELVSWTIRRSVNRLACSGPYIKNRTLFGVYDFVALYAHFVSGVALAVSRLMLTYVDFAVNFARLDLPVVEGTRQHWDAGHTSFMAMLYLDFFYNAPITSTLAYNLSAAMYHRRELKQIADADMTRKGHLLREKARTSMVQRNRWHLLFTMDRNKENLAKLRMKAPPPPNSWDVDDDVLDMLSVEEDASETKADSDDELRPTPR